MYSRNGAFEFYVNDGGTWRSKKTPGNIRNGWHHIAGTISRDGIKVYVDGIVSSHPTGITNQMIQNAASSVSVGADIRLLNRLNERYYDGAFREVRIWNKERSQADIQADMNRQLSGNEEGLVEYYRFDNPNSLTITDHSGNGRHGTLKNMDSPWLSEALSLDDARISASETVNLPASFVDLSTQGSTYAWTQVSGPTAVISNADEENASFVAPAVSSDTTLIFAVQTSNPFGAAHDTVTFSLGAADLADLSLTLSIDNPAPDSGDVVIIDLETCNAGPERAINTFVGGLDHDALTIDSSSMTAGNLSGGLWNILTLDADSCATYSITATVDSVGTFDFISQVIATKLLDPDSTPDDNEGDDYDELTFTASQSSGGGDGGLESNGNLAIALGQRMFRRQQIQNRTGKQVQSVIPFASARQSAISSAPGFQGGFMLNELTDVIPATGPEGVPALTVTPRDLIGVTNAESVISVDYIRDDSRRLGAIFGVTTETGVLYEHTKVVCDRLTGAKLNNTSLVQINGHDFILNQLEHADGSIDFAITFVAHRIGSEYVIDSRFTQKQYDLEIPSDDIVTFQVWSISPDYTQNIVQDMLDNMTDQGYVTYFNNNVTVPDSYIKSGYYESGKLYLTMINAGPAHQITFEGTTASVEEGIRQAFTASVYVPEARTGKEVTVVVPTGFVFDASFAMYDEDGNGFDQLFFSDGVWGYNADEEGANITSFSTAANSIQEPDGSTFPIARTAKIEGERQTWATLYRFLRANGQPQDLTHFENLTFWALGTGTIEVILVKESIESFEDQAKITFELPVDLEPGEKTFAEYVLNFEDFDANFDASDITMIAFNSIGDGNNSESFSLHVFDVRFAGGNVTTAIEEEEVPEAFALDQSYPNPFNPQTTIGYSLPQASRVKVTVYDVAGRRINVLVNQNQAAGQYQVQFDGAGLASGLYFYRIEALGHNGEQFSQVRKMMLVK